MFENTKFLCNLFSIKEQKIDQVTKTPDTNSISDFLEQLETVNPELSKRNSETQVAKLIISLNPQKPIGLAWKKKTFNVHGGKQEVSIIPAHRIDEVKLNRPEDFRNIGLILLNQSIITDPFAELSNYTQEEISIESAFPQLLDQPLVVENPVVFTFGKELDKIFRRVKNVEQSPIEYLYVQHTLLTIGRELIFQFNKNFADKSQFIDNTIQNQITDEDVQRIKIACDYLGKKWQEENALQSLYQVAAMSRSKFFKLFPIITGITPMQYINQLRFSYAKDQLINTTLSEEQIAINCGFENRSSLYRLFKRVTGKSPSHFRSKINKPC